MVTFLNLYIFFRPSWFGKPIILLFYYHNIFSLHVWLPLKKVSKIIYSILNVQLLVKTRINGLVFIDFKFQILKTFSEIATTRRPAFEATTRQPFADLTTIRPALTTTTARSAARPAQTTTRPRPAEPRKDGRVKCFACGSLFSTDAPDCQKFDFQV